MGKKYYVTMTDSFLSGWGLSTNIINKLVVECDTLHQSQIIEKNAKEHSEMRRVNVCRNKPYYNKDIYSTSRKSFSDMGGVWLNGYIEPKEDVTTTNNNDGYSDNYEYSIHKL